MKMALIRCAGSSGDRKIISIANSTAIGGALGRIAERVYRSDGRINTSRRAGRGESRGLSIRPFVKAETQSLFSGIDVQCAHLGTLRRETEYIESTRRIQPALRRGERARTGEARGLSLRRIDQRANGREKCRRDYLVLGVSKRSRPSQRCSSRDKNNCPLETFVRSASSAYCPARYRICNMNIAMDHRRRGK